MQANQHLKVTSTRERYRELNKRSFPDKLKANARYILVTIAIVAGIIASIQIGSSIGNFWFAIIGIMFSFAVGLKFV